VSIETCRGFVAVLSLAIVMSRADGSARPCAAMGLAAWTIVLFAIARRPLARSDSTNLVRRRAYASPCMTGATMRTRRWHYWARRLGQPRGAMFVGTS
jgi:hypothetical protein